MGEHPEDKRNKAVQVLQSMQNSRLSSETCTHDASRLCPESTYNTEQWYYSIICIAELWCHVIDGAVMRSSMISGHH